MDRSLRGIAVVVAAFALCATQAEAQVSRDQLIIGHWECTVSGVDHQYERITADYDAANAMQIKFYSVMNNGAIRMSLTLSGPWTFDPTTGAINETISAARIDDMIVNGQPMARSQHPAGEAGLARLEADFVAQYGNSPFVVTALDERALVLTDGGGDTLNCAR